MRVALCYPPLVYQGRVPVMTQSRIFSFTHSREVRIYPLVMAQAATLLKRDGFAVAWMDGIAADESPAAWRARLEAGDPDLVVLETKASLVTRHWEFIRDLKIRLPRTRVVLAGDHVSYFPKESLRACPVDYVATGGDYDLSVLGIARHLRGDARSLPGGVWRLEGGRAASTGAVRQLKDLSSLPWIDRDLTEWWRYGEAYLHRPVAYILSGRGCGTVKGPGRCTFCIWQYAFWGKRARLRDPGDVAREIASLVDRYGVREVFDDNEAGGMWDLAWLRAFTEELERIGVAGRVMISSNCRADSVTPDRVGLMKRAGFRLLKIALESGNDDTLRRIAKDETVEEVVRGVKLAKDHGFAVMVTTMVGFPWETEFELQRTYDIARELLLYKAKPGDCLEANIVIPYPGTPLHRYILDHGWFAVPPGDYDRYGLSRPVVKAPVDPVLWARRIWGLHRDPRFLVRSLASVRSWRDLELAFRGLRSLLGHERDYEPGTEASAPVS